MRKLVYVMITIMILALFIVSCGTKDIVAPEVLDKAKPDKCTTIQSGEIYASNGDLITTGYDEFGYNYQAHIFNGRYCDYDRELGGDSCDVNLIMKWNDAWLSNKDCDGDGLLDRPDSYIGSGAWCTNHMWGEYEAILDEFNIGETPSELGHNLEGWSDPWNGEGYYGGGDDGTFRLLMGPGDGCGEGYEEATFTMNTCGGEAEKIILRHLDGSQNDSFELFIIENDLSETYVGSYIATGGSEEWVDTEFTFEARSGEIKFKLVATNPATQWCAEWGQVAFSYATLEGICYWDYLVKIVAVPEDANLDNNTWYAEDGTEIGLVEWGAFATVQSVYNDPCGGYHGVEYLSPAGPGLGKW